MTLVPLRRDSRPPAHPHHVARPPLWMLLHNSFGFFMPSSVALRISVAVLREGVACNVHCLTSPRGRARSWHVADYKRKEPQEMSTSDDFFSTFF